MIRYKALINARVPPKRNNKEKAVHKDFHYTSAQVSIVNEMATICKQDTIAFSVDNKNKVEVGIPATSRRTNLRAFSRKKMLSATTTMTSQTQTQN